MDAHITQSTQSDNCSLAGRTREALSQALLGQGKLPAEVLALPGMSGRKYRLFINNLLSTLSDPRYLEVGVWAGSTLCSAIYGNRLRAVAIDNWSQFEGPSERFFQNLARFKGRDARVSFIEDDFRAVNYAALGRFNVYLFDGPHTREDQHDGVAFALPALDDTFVLIVDDWNWPQVREATSAAIQACGLRIDYAAEIRTTLDDSHAPVSGEHSDWHNGYFVGVLVKPA